MYNRFNLKKEQLNDNLQDAIICIESLQDLIFDHAEDWTKKNQGYTLFFNGSLYKNKNQTWEEANLNIKAQFCHNPMTRTVEEDTSDFEGLENKGNNSWAIYIA